jgi:endogenous inhibitor of DNA gyrase (YacG/DUF329 family)
MADEPLCVYCRQRPVDPRWRPFCGERCKMADLGRWLKGDYSIPGPSDDHADAPASLDEEEEDPPLWPIR